MKFPAVAMIRFIKFQFVSLLEQFVDMLVEVEDYDISKVSLTMLYIVISVRMKAHMNHTMSSCMVVYIEPFFSLFIGELFLYCPIVLFLKLFIYKLSESDQHLLENMLDGWFVFVETGGRLYVIYVNKCINMPRFASMDIDFLSLI